MFAARPEKVTVFSLCLFKLILDCKDNTKCLETTVKEMKMFIPK